jgi:SAM-dependent methyltransferase
MHKESLAHMQSFKDRYVMTNGGRVLDFGSKNVNGTYKSIWSGWDYIGVDIEEGNNVDVVIPHNSGSVPVEPVDVVISGQCLEHCQEPWVAVWCMASALKPGGLACVIVPFVWKIHAYPADYYRFCPDGLSHLLRRFGGLDILECGIQSAAEAPVQMYDNDPAKTPTQHRDVVAVARRTTGALDLLLGRDSIFPPGV